jgi:hypothetical protein
VRRFLEQHYNSLDLVVFAVENIDVGIYEVLLPLYFPRSLQEEETALWQLPASVGGPDGEPLLPDRQIRIIDNPQHSLDGELLIHIVHFSAMTMVRYIYHVPVLNCYISFIYVLKCSYKKLFSVTVE